jgi:hypothetical protein
MHRSSNGRALSLHGRDESSILSRCTNFISLSVSGYATSFGARISWVRVPQERPNFMRGSFNGKITGFHPVVESSILSPRTSFRILTANLINFSLYENLKANPVISM